MNNESYDNNNNVIITTKNKYPHLDSNIARSDPILWNTKEPSSSPIK